MSICLQDIGLARLKLEEAKQELVRLEDVCVGNWCPVQYCIDLAHVRRLLLKKNWQKGWI